MSSTIWDALKNFREHEAKTVAESLIYTDGERIKLEPKPENKKAYGNLVTNPKLKRKSK